MLRADTQALWRRLSGEPLLTGFVLVGGSALAMHMDHRISEDLDFVYVGTGGAVPTLLPTHRLEGVCVRLRAAGVVIEDATRPGDLDEFEVAGLNIAEHQQTLTAGTVSLSFFMPDEPLRCALRPGQEGGPRVADLDELFASKALVAASRSKTRDWFDLYHLMRMGGYSMEDFVAAFERCSTPTHLSVALTRLCSGRPQMRDEGFASLLPEPPTVEAMASFFTQERARYEVAWVEARGRLVGQEAPPSLGSQQSAYPQSPPGDEAEPEQRPGR